jgi:hypothetical protein
MAYGRHAGGTGMNTYQGPARQLAASQLFPRKRLSLAAQATQCSPFSGSAQVLRTYGTRNRLLKGVKWLLQLASGNTLHHALQCCLRTTPGSQRLTQVRGGFLTQPIACGLPQPAH